MPINITMPALSPTMEEGTLAKWLVKEGDKVSPGDVIAEIETDKATMEVEAVDEGVVARILVPAGSQGVKVNATIAVLSADGEAVDAEPAAKAEETPSTAAKADEKPAAENSTPAAEKSASVPEAKSQAQAAPAKSGERVFASPLARRIAKDAGVDLASVKGTGPQGRIVRADVEAAAKAGPAAAKPASAATGQAAAAPLAKGPGDDAVRKLFAEGSFEEIPHDNMRKTIARRLVESKQTVPHFYLTVDCDLDALLALRKQLNDAAPMIKTEAGDKPAYKLSVNDMVIKAMACALHAVPDANVSWTESAMLKHRNADVGVAVSIEGGLITPIIRKADEKTLSVISNEMKDLAKRARNRKLKPEEYQGGTTAVSNLGMFGVKDFAAVINPPHATILAVGAGEERAVVRNGEIKIANVMSVTLSTDHRAVDGALGAQLLAAFKKFIEAPMAMLV
ncbi:pyruvate dehydrogenase complex dihydrolipoamide acetyltransferase [Aureimonas fodinaquatilis]|uniref:Acetyltransferase component of pyruvate dehydrogenase complex n=1 Tax=Aureimonas fodinaquatilis TaxID=2565783 RepID=A0A5B0DY31_9HYPH|nr:pyruvate dehydrogenase complex dihydrolipoamide acetyltransferase [Aureimonas fodinaquatilis]KAA0970470.1 pyruvate dehydrogenase complex dihydrolipoamide acetyltransferase [Aureimonas fodinaquatilis]